MWEARFSSVKVLFLAEILLTLTIMLCLIPDFFNSKYETKQTEVSLLCKIFKSVGLSVNSVFIFHSNFCFSSTSDIKISLNPL